MAKARPKRPRPGQNGEPDAAEMARLRAAFQARMDRLRWVTQTVYGLNREHLGPYNPQTGMNVWRCGDPVFEFSHVRIRRGETIPDGLDPKYYLPDDPRSRPA